LIRNDPDSPDHFMKAECSALVTLLLITLLLITLLLITQLASAAEAVLSGKHLLTAS